MRYFIMYTQTAVLASTSFPSYAKDTLRRCESFVHCMCMVIWKPIPHAASMLLPDRRQPGSCERHKQTCKTRLSLARECISRPPRYYYFVPMLPALRGEDARNGGSCSAIGPLNLTRAYVAAENRGPVEVHCDNPQKARHQQQQP
jgi:hypothetical protein